ncbi:MAG: DNA polymerase III subunit gamma/tau, partial [Rikenellaceae bacterium]|nr:DNA polymerase III subunit gamma/tau [Rikenellaceae bacterium]
PATFESVVGQGHITSTLRNAISRGQLAHAYLFCGPRGVGKTTCARIFAKAINCLTPSGNEACGECESCKSFNEGRSFNIHELDAASNNSVDDIRSLTEQVRIPPQIGRYSVYIIDEVHMLSAAAFNAFLKTLEEPPAHAVFILATTEKHKIIPTILSRCQIYDFNRIRVEDGVKYLRYIAGQENVVCDDESLHLIAQKADGGMRDALSMFDKAVSFCGTRLDFKSVARTLNVLDYDTYFNITDNILSGDYPAALTALDGILRKGFSPQTFAAGLNVHFRDLLMCRTEQTAGLLEVTGSLLERYKEQAARCETGFLFEALSLVTSVDNGLRTATNQRLNVELCLMKLCLQGQKKNRSSQPATPDEPLNGLTLPERRTGGASTAYAAAPSPTRNPAAAAPTPQTATAPHPVAAGMAAAATKRDDRPEPAGNVGPVSAPKLQPGVESPGKETAGTPDRSGPIPETKAEPEPKKPEAEAVPHRDGPEPVTSAHRSEPNPGEDKKGADPAAAPPKKQPLRSALSGTSISDLLEKPVGIYDMPSEENEEGKAIPAADPDTARKIGKHRERFLKLLGAGRPRLAVPFREMEIGGNKITVTVPTADLRDEILRNRTEILTLLADTSSVNGYIELAVEIKEDSGPKLPVRVEDRLRYLTEKNPALTLLRQKLEMDIE